MGSLSGQSANDFGGAASFVSASYGGSVASSVFATGTAIGVQQSVEGAGLASLDFYYQVVPIVPTLTTSVPIDVLFSISTTANYSDTANPSGSFSYAIASFNFGAVNGQTQYYCTAIPRGSGGFPCTTDSVNIVQASVVGYANAGTIYEVQLEADVLVQFGATATASIDPQFYIDPSFADAADFALVVSPVPQSTPEPSSSLLLGGGLLAMAGILRRKRKPA